MSWCLFLFRFLLNELVPICNNRFPKMFSYMINHPEQDRYYENELFPDKERYMYMYCTCTCMCASPLFGSALFLYLFHFVALFPRHPHSHFFLYFAFLPQYCFHHSIFLLSALAPCSPSCHQLHFVTFLQIQWTSIFLLPSSCSISFLLFLNVIQTTFYLFLFLFNSWFCYLVVVMSH